jgi:DNA-binding transcriptional regulator YiaG
MWGGGKTRKGYGVIQEGGRGSKLLLAHRVSYEQFHGSIPDGLSVLHSCDHPWCVNPAHLRSGTQSENIKEAYSKGRKISPSRSGEDSPRSKLTAEQVKMIRENPSVGHTRMAAMFGVTPSCIRNVRSGRTWAKPSPGHVA